MVIDIRVFEVGWEPCFSSSHPAMRPNPLVKILGGRRTVEQTCKPSKNIEHDISDKSFQFSGILCQRLKFKRDTL